MTTLITLVTVESMTFVVAALMISWVWLSRTTATATASILILLFTMVHYSTEPVMWGPWWVFPGQVTMPLACVLLATVHFRLGCLAAHRVWRTCSIALILFFLFTTRFYLFPTSEGLSIADHYNAQVQFRTYASAMFLFIIAGGIGQVIWRYLDDKPPVWRYVTIIAAVGPSSILHSFASFWQRKGIPAEIFNEAVMCSVAATFFLSIPIITMLLGLVWFNGADDRTVQARLIRHSARDITPRGAHHGGNKSRKSN